MTAVRQTFRGAITGVGSTSGVRLVVGHWTESPFGRFADVMVETAAGHRVLLAPTSEVASFIEGTYEFDETRVEAIAAVMSAERVVLQSPSLSLDVRVGGRTAVGRLLGAVPRRLAESPGWCTVTDPFARVLLRGVRTRGVARAGRREWYGATDVRAVTSLSGHFDALDLGRLAAVDPPCRFGFSSTPRRPSVTTVVTTVDLEST